MREQLLDVPDQVRRLRERPRQGCPLRTPVRGREQMAVVVGKRAGKVRVLRISTHISTLTLRSTPVLRAVPGVCGAQALLVSCPRLEQPSAMPCIFFKPHAGVPA